jgi:hypothetical protein
MARARGSPMARNTPIAPGPARWQHHLPCAAWWTASPLRPSLSFRYTQARPPLHDQPIRCLEKRDHGHLALGIAIANEVHKLGTRLDAIVIGMLVSSFHAESLAASSSLIFSSSRSVTSCRNRELGSVTRYSHLRAITSSPALNTTISLACYGLLPT